MLFDAVFCGCFQVWLQALWTLIYRLVADGSIRRVETEQQANEGLGCERQRSREFESGTGLAAKTGQVPARANAFPRGGSKRSRAGTRSQTCRGLRLPGKYLLAAKRSRGPDVVPVARFEPEPARRATAALPVD